jgi:hypothetical protein
VGLLIDDLLAFSKLGRQALQKQRVLPEEVANRAITRHDQMPPVSLPDRVRCRRLVVRRREQGRGGTPGLFDSVAGLC